MAANPLGVVLPIRLGSNGYFNNTTKIDEQVRANLTNLLLTQKGERLFQPDFGCDLPSTLFEQISDDAIAEANAAVATAVQIWMPFVRINDIAARRDSEHTLILKITYTILTANITDSITLVL